MSTLLDANILQGVGNEILTSLGAAIISITGGYILIRERILKNEMKTNSMTNYIDSKYELLENRIGELQKDIAEFKELNKETSKALADNTMAIRELRVVLDMLKEQLGVKAIRKVKNALDD